MLAPGTRVLCAVSGGADSLALADSLLELRKELQVDLALAHVDHRLRPDSEKDAARVAGFARERGVPFFLREVQVSARGSREEAAREARLIALQEMASQFGATRIALGHTATDRAETLLLFLARGAGRRGLSSMEPVRDALFIRPLCEVTRRESRAHAAARRLPFADDPTNDDLSYHRNRVRSSVLPWLRALNPRADQALAAAAQDLAAEERILEEQAAALCATHWCRVGEARFCRAARLQEVPLPLRARMWLSTIAAVRGSRRGLTRKHLELAEALLSPGAREAHLPGAHAWRDGAYVCVATRRPARPARVTPVRVEAPGRFQPRPGIEFEFRLLEIREGKVSGDTHAEFDARAVHFPLWIRGPHPSDWMRLEGGGRQKIARQLMNAAVPTSLRQGWLMVSDAEEVLWVPGLRQSATGRPSAESKEVLSIRARGLMFPDPYATQIEGRVSL